MSTLHRCQSAKDLRFSFSCALCLVFVPLKLCQLLAAPVTAVVDLLPTRTDLTSLSNSSTQTVFHEAVAADAEAVIVNASHAGLTVGSRQGGHSEQSRSNSVCAALMMLRNCCYDSWPSVFVQECIFRQTPSPILMSLDEETRGAKSDDDATVPFCAWVFWVHLLLLQPTASDVRIALTSSDVH